MDVLEDLKNRGLIHQATNLSGLEQRLKKGPIVLYYGIDPTGKSLHLGHLLHLITLKRFLNEGHKIILVLGGATGLIGDPSGKSEERPLLGKKVIQQNIVKLTKQLQNFFKSEKTKERLLILNNYQWYSQFKLLDFLREVGKNFTVSYLLAKESVKNRLEIGISFTEFSYNLLQAYDFYYLYKKFNCELQIGGSDQWGNITSGIDFIRKLENKEVFGLTLPLLTSSGGEKWGKSTGKGVWLDKKLTSPYSLYQFLFNTSDNDASRFLKYLTFLTKEELVNLEKKHFRQPEKRLAQKTLAFLVTKLVHGKKEALEAEKISQALFYGNIKSLSEKELEIALKDLPTFVLKQKDDKISLIDLLVLSKISSSKREARQDVSNGIIFINDLQFKKIESIIEKSLCLFKKYLIIKRGKKNYFLVLWK
ncbi:MAG: tyrosine--tRNA ligase [Minisyncoccia bacterium]